MKIVQKIGIIFLLAIFFFSTIGITIYKHICLAHANIEISIYPEVFSKHSSCCCGETDFSNPTSKHQCKHPSIAGNDCCQNISLYLRIPILSLTVRHHSLELIIQVICLPEMIKPDRENFAIVVHDPNFSASPPLSGQRRILMFHQLKTDSASDHLS